MSKNWITGLIIFLLTANLALITTLLITNNREDKKIRDIRDFRFCRNNLQKQEHRTFEMHIAEQLEMDDSQRDRLQNYSYKFHEQRKDMERKILSVREKYYNALANASPDKGLLESLADSLGMFHSTLIKLDYQHYQDIKSICTPEQAAKFDSLGRLHMNKMRDKNCRGEYQHPKHKQIRRRFIE